MYRLRFLIAFVALAQVMTGCGNSTPSEDEHIDIGASPSTNEYSITTFMNLPQFQAKVMYKYIDPYRRGSITNHSFLLYLEKDKNSAEICVHSDDASALLMQAVITLQTNHDYAFPDILRVTN